MGKHKHFKFMGFLNILGEAEVHAVPKIGKSKFTEYRKSMGKH